MHAGGTVSGMTLHIPRGLLIAGDLADPFTLVKAVRPVTTGVAERLWDRLVAARAAQHIDAVRCGKAGCLSSYEESTPDVAAAAARELGPQVREATADQVRRNPRYDFGFTLKVLPHPEVPDTLLGIVLTEHDAYTEALTTLPGVVEYGWWQAEDPPAEDWDTRHRVWTSALRHGRWSDEALTWQLIPTHFSLAVRHIDRRPDLGRVLAAMPDQTSRARALAADLAVVPEGDAVDVTNYVRVMTKALEDAYPVALEALRPITVEDLAWAR